MTLAELTDRANAFRDARDWRQFHDPKDLMLSLSLEAAELLEHAQWRSGDDLKDHLSARREAVGEELSDILYWTLVLVDDLGIDLGEAFLRKLEKNEKKYPVEKARGRSTKYDQL